MHDDDRGYDYEMGVFPQPASDLSDDELRVSLAMVCERRDEVAEADPVLAGMLNTVACVLADERDRRRALYRAVEDAVCPVQVMMPARVLRSPSERRRDRRR